MTLGLCMSMVFISSMQLSCVAPGQFEKPAGSSLYSALWGVCQMLAGSRWLKAPWMRGNKTLDPDARLGSGAAGTGLRIDM